MSNRNDNRNTFGNAALVGRPGPVDLRAPLPGVPQGMSPRLPIGPAYLPPALVAQIPAMQAPPPVINVADHYEVWSGIVPLPAAQEVPIYETTRPWSGVDVHGGLISGTLAGGEIATIAVYAISGANRTRIATGRLGPAAVTAKNEPLWLCGARIAAERFLVTLRCTAAAPAGDLSVAVTARNDLPAVPDWVGTTSLATGGGGGFPNTIMTTTAAFAPALAAQPVALTATQLVAGPRWVQLFNTSAAPVNGQVPFLSIGMPAGIGQSVNLDRLWQRMPIRQLLTFTGIGIGISSTGDLLTLAVAGDVAWNFWFR